MDKQAFNEAANTCEMAIGIILKLWPTHKTDFDEEIKETLQKLNYLKDDMIDESSKLPFQQ